MAAPESKLDYYRLETEFHDNYVVHTTYEWGRKTTQRRRKTSVWEWKKQIGAGGYGVVWLEEQKGGGQLRAVKRLTRDLLPAAGFSQELLALVKLRDVSAPG